MRSCWGNYLIFALIELSIMIVSIFVSLLAGLILVGFIARG